MTGLAPHIAGPWVVRTSISDADPSAVTEAKAPTQVDEPEVHRITKQERMLARR